MGQLLACSLSNRNGQVQSPVFLPEDVLIDVSRFLTRPELARGMGQSNRLLHCFFSTRLYERGDFVVDNLVIRPKRENRLRFWRKRKKMEEGKNEIGRKMVAKNGENLKKLQFPELAPSPNIVYFGKISLADCRIDATLIAFFRHISTRSIRTLVLCRMDSFLRKNSLEEITALLRNIRKCAILRIEKCSTNSLASILGFPRVVAFHRLALIKNYRENFCPFLFEWLHSVGGKGKRKRPPRRLTLFFGRQIGNGLCERFPLIELIKNDLSNMHRRHFYLRVFCHIDVQFYPIGRHIGQIEEFRQENVRKKESVEMRKMAHPSGKMMVIYLRRGPSMKAEMPCNFGIWQKQYYRECLED